MPVQKVTISYTKTVDIYISSYPDQLFESRLRDYLARDFDPEEFALEQDPVIEHYKSPVEIVPGHQSVCFASERQEKRGLK